MPIDEFLWQHRRLGNCGGRGKALFVEENGGGVAVAWRWRGGGGDGTWLLMSTD